MDYRHFRVSRIGLTLVIAATGCLSAPAARAAGPGGGSAVSRAPQGPIFKTLDALAGGIESVLQRTVLSKRKAASCDARGCDAIGCDDGCDRATLQQLERLPRGGAAFEQIPLTRPIGPVPGAHYMHGAQQMPGTHGNGAYGNGAQQMPDTRVVPEVQPMPNIQPVPRTLPRVPADRRAAPPALSGEDGWIESFTPSPQSGQKGQAKPAAPPNQHYDALPNPFLDDPQSSR